jgi:NAD-dependent dihydropyrimidine dehydrogenase PreA subunit
MTTDDDRTRQLLVWLGAIDLPQTVLLVCDHAEPPRVITGEAAVKAIGCVTDVPVGLPAQLLAFGVGRVVAVPCPDDVEGTRTAVAGWAKVLRDVALYEPPRRRRRWKGAGPVFDLAAPMIPRRFLFGLRPSGIGGPFDSEIDEAGRVVASIRHLLDRGRAFVPEPEPEPAFDADPDPGRGNAATAEPDPDSGAMSPPRRPDSRASGAGHPSAAMRVCPDTAPAGSQVAAPGSTSPVGAPGSASPAGEGAGPLPAGSGSTGEGATEPSAPVPPAARPLAGHVAPVVSAGELVDDGRDAHAPGSAAAGSSSVVGIQLVASGCDGCGVCVRACPTQSLALEQRGEATVLKHVPDLCRADLSCIGLCPQGALSSGRSYTAIELARTEPVELAVVATVVCARCGARYPAGTGELCKVCSFRRDNPFGARTDLIPPHLLRSS